MLSSRADFGACPFCGYSAASEPFGACPCSCYSTTAGSHFRRRLPLLRIHTRDAADYLTRTKTEKREVELEEYIQEAHSFVQHNKNPPALDSDSRSSHFRRFAMPDKLFLDYAYVYGDRLTTLKSFWLLDEETTYDALCIGFSKTFDLTYSKIFQGMIKIEPHLPWAISFLSL